MTMTTLSAWDYPTPSAVVEAAIDVSIRTNCIPTIVGRSTIDCTAIRAELSLQCDDGDGDTYWGTDDDGADWRVAVED